MKTLCEIGGRLLQQNILRTLSILGVVSVLACSHSPSQAARGQAVVNSSASDRCRISDREREALLKLDYKSFDQTLPDGGWRRYDGCDALMQSLLDAYTELHSNTLEPWQRGVLVWHSGQVTAFMGDYPGAIDRMEQTLKKDESPSADFLWNPYVNATIAFLKKDKPALLRERGLLAKGLSPYNQVNLRIVDAFIRCFDSSYRGAYSNTCEPNESNLE